jgi:hypothetical protein
MHPFQIRMALVHPNSCECTKSKLDLFEVPPTQTSVAYGYWEQKGLTSALTDQGPYKFAVSGAGESKCSIPVICTYLLWTVNAFRDVNPLLSVVLLS